MRILLPLGLEFRHGSAVALQAHTVAVGKGVDLSAAPYSREQFKEIAAAAL